MGRRIPIQGLTGVLNKEAKLYWCNGEVKSCPKSFCYKNGGGCFMTRDKKYEAEMKDVLNSEDRVKQYNYWNSHKAPVEKKKSSNKVFVQSGGIFLNKDTIEKEIRQFNMKNAKNTNDTSTKS